MTDTQPIAQRIELWPPCGLIPIAKNPRTHSDAQVAQIAGSIVKPILAERHAGESKSSVQPGRPSQTHFERTKSQGQIVSSPGGDHASNEHLMAKRPHRQPAWAPAVWR